MTPDSLETLFRDPPSKFRSTPFWIWNTQMTREGIKERLKDFKDKGCGGILIKARVGLEIAYLGDMWFELWDYALEECKKLGLSCNIYDENHFPPPMAGGQTCIDTKIPYRWIEWDNENNCVAEKESQPTEWCGGFAAPDSLRPEVTQAFIKNTYEQYQKRFGDSYGKEILLSYNDEPGCRGVRGSRKGLPYSPWLNEELKHHLGRDISKELFKLFKDELGCEATRFDYYQSLQFLFEKNYKKPLHDFCEDAGIVFTGHLWEENWPAPFDCPSVMSACRWYHEPGLDLLGPMYISGDEDVNALGLLMLKQVTSVAHQMGSKQVCAELFGASGYETAMDQLAPLAAFAMVNGVTHVVEHMAMQSIVGSRKYDFPQTLGPQASWWKHYRSLTDTMARSCVAASAGKAFARVLVLLPTTTGWIYANPENPQILRDMQKSLSELLKLLTQAGIDYDLGDELLMADMASVCDGSLKVGHMNYQVLVMPEQTNNLCQSTVKILEELTLSNFPIYYGTKHPSFINGRPSYERLKQCFAPLHSFNDTAQLLLALKKLCPPLLSFKQGVYPKTLEHGIRILEDGRHLLLLCNSGKDELHGEIQNGNWLRMDPNSGSIQKLLKGELKLDSGEICVLLEDLKLTELPVLAEQAWIKPTWKKVERLDPNVLLLDFCDLEIGSKKYKDIYVTQANLHLWEAHGFSSVPWIYVQYGDTLIAKEFEADSSFKVSYHFEIDPQSLAHIKSKSCQLAVERPALHKISVNGHSLNDFSERWMDENIYCSDISNFLCAGINHVELSVDKMSFLQEIDRVYLLGDFSLTPSAKSFIVTRPTPLTLGNWTLQGLPFYNGRVLLSGEIQSEKDFSSIKVHGGWDAGVLGLSIDEQKEVALHKGTYNIHYPIKAGTHKADLIFYSTPRNLLGPHFWKTEVAPYKRLTGYYSWRWHAPEKSVPAQSYELLPFGSRDEISFQLRTL